MDNPEILATLGTQNTVRRQCNTIKTTVTHVLGICHDLSRFLIPSLGPLVYSSQTLLNSLAISILRVPDEGHTESTWWRSYWEYLMKVILRVHDEGYSESTWWRLFWEYMMKVILRVHDEGYSESTWWRLFWEYLMKVILRVHDEGYSESTWWRLFQKRVVCTKFDLYVLEHNIEN